MNNTFCVYMHTNKLNNKKYIGITKNEPEKRWNKGSGYKKCPAFWNAILKYGWQSFEHTILYKGLTKNEASEKEIELIEKYNTTNARYGYNISKGGYGKYSFVLSDESKKKIALNNKGEKNPMFGKHHSEETKLKMRNKKLGTKVSKETREKQSQCRQRGDNGNAKSIICLDDNKRYNCIEDAAEYYSVSASKISAVCRGKRKHTGGYHFRYD